MVRLGCIDYPRRIHISAFACGSILERPLILDCSYYAMAFIIRLADWKFRGKFAASNAPDFSSKLHIK